MAVLQKLSSINFVTHASADVGLGHLKRCLVLYQQFVSLGVVGKIYVPHNSMISDRVHKYPGIELVDDLNLLDSAFTDLCIVDRYCYESQWYQILKKSCHRLAVFDDECHHIPQQVNAVINLNLSTDQCPYPDSIKTFCGPIYNLVDPAFFSTSVHVTTKNCFICMGGSDPERISRKMVELVLEETDCSVTVVLGPGFEWQDDQTWLQNMPRVNCVSSPESMPDVLAGALFVLVSSGSLLSEVLSMGIPAICISLADNQRKIAQSYAKRKAVKYAGHHDDLNWKQLREEVVLFAEDKVYRTSFAERANSICHPLGAKRLAKDILYWLNNENL